MELKIPHLKTHHGKLHPATHAQIWPSIATQTTAITPLASRNHIKGKHPKATRVRHIPRLYAAGIKRIQGIVDTVLYHARAVNNKILTTLSSIGSEQARATQVTKKSANNLLDYLATYQNDGITYRSSSTILAAQSDAAYLNETCSCSRAGSHILCSDNKPIPGDNGPVLSMDQITNVVIYSASEAELAGLFITIKERVPLRKTHKETKWPQSCSII